MTTVRWLSKYKRVLWFSYSLLSNIFSFDRSECTPLQVPVIFVGNSEQTICTRLYHFADFALGFSQIALATADKGIVVDFLEANDLQCRTETGVIKKKVLRDDPPRNKISVRWQRHWSKYGRHSFARNGSQKQTGQARDRVVDDQWGGTLDICNCCILKRNETNFSQSAGRLKVLLNWLSHQQILKKLPRASKIEEPKETAPSVQGEL